MIRQTALQTVRSAFFAVILHTGMAQGQPGVGVPSVPPNLEVPAGHVPYLKSRALGTQNYVCVPNGTGAEWKFLGPQATLFVPIPWMGGEAQFQLGTHFLSANPDEGGVARPTWQSSLDSSAVWGRVVASSTDSQYVDAGAIPWLLVEIVGSRRGPLRGAAMAQTTYIQRVKTAGGIAPKDGCDASTYGQIALVPYETDYVYYQAAGKK